MGSAGEQEWHTFSPSLILGCVTCARQGRTLPFAATLTVLGAVLGTALDGIHR